MNEGNAPPPLDLGAEAAMGLGEWALVAVVATGGLAYLVRGFAKRRKSGCGGCAGCDKSGACPVVKLDEPSREPVKKIASSCWDRGRSG